MSKWPSYKTWGALTASLTGHAVMIYALVWASQPGSVPAAPPSPIIEVSLVPAFSGWATPTETGVANPAAPPASTDIIANAAPASQMPATPEAQPVQTGDASGPPLDTPASAMPIGTPVFDHYGEVLRAHIRRYRGYPMSARRDHVEGQVLLHFLMDREGHVLDAYVEHSSGFPSLDAEALATINRAQPLPAIPDKLPDRLSLTLPVSFSLQP
jgi:periplasmic protein TonB